MKPSLDKISILHHPNVIQIELFGSRIKRIISWLISNKINISLMFFLNRINSILLFCFLSSNKDFNRFLTNQPEFFKTDQTQ